MQEMKYGVYKYHITLPLTQGHIRSNFHKIYFIFKTVIKILLPLFIVLHYRCIQI